jgi:hypothetical protein
LLRKLAKPHGLPSTNGELAKRAVATGCATALGVSTGAARHNVRAWGHLKRKTDTKFLHHVFLGRKV